MRVGRTTAVFAVTMVLASGCAQSTSASKDTSGSDMGMTASQMKAMGGASNHAAPSATARMACSNEIRGAVRRALGLTTMRTPTHTWSDSLFRCRYDVPGGALLLEVKDSTDAAGRRWFDGLRGRLDARAGGVTPLRGVEALGLPSFETDVGDVVFLKDGKTLHVDARGLREPALPAGFSRTEVAYAVASAVVACWSE